MSLRLQFFSCVSLSFAGLLLANGRNVPFIRFELLSMRSFCAVHTLYPCVYFVRFCAFLVPYLPFFCVAGAPIPPPQARPGRRATDPFHRFIFFRKNFFSYFCPYEQRREIDLGFRRRAEEVQRRVGRSFRFHQGCLQGDGRAVQSDLRLRERRDEKGGWLRVAKGRGGGVGFPSFLFYACKCLKINPLFLKCRLSLLKSP